MKKYYVYCLLDPRKYYLPFYVGKGCGDCAWAHLRENSPRYNPHKDNIIASIRRGGMEPKVFIWDDHLDEETAYSIEKQLIARFGRRSFDPGGILTNILTDGCPPSPLGRDVSDDTRKKIAAAQQGEKNHRWGKTNSDESNELRRQANKLSGIKPPVRRGPMSEETKQKIREANSGKKRTPEQSAYLSEIRRGKTRVTPSPETVEKIRKANTGIVKRKWTDEEKASHAKLISSRYDDPQYRKKMVESAKRGWETRLRNERLGKLRPK